MKKTDANIEALFLYGRRDCYIMEEELSRVASLCPNGKLHIYGVIFFREQFECAALTVREMNPRSGR